MLIGESYIGEGAEAAHVNTVFGERSGPVGVAWATALASPSAGHTPFVAVVIPGLPVKPMTLFVNKAPIADDEHGTLTWGAAQAGVAGGVADAVSEGIISADEADQSVIIAAVWVNPAARDAEKVYANNRTATREALRAGVEGAPQMAEVLAARHRPFNPFYSPPSGGQEPAGSGADGGGREPGASGAGRGRPGARGQRRGRRRPGPGSRAAVKITAIRLDRMRLPLDPPFRAAWDPVPRRHFDATLVRVETDEGITGFGSGDTMDGFAAFADLFIGRDPRQIASHVLTIETINFHAGRYWPLEAALWDIIGQAAGQPVSALFGAACTRLPAYASFGELKSPAERADAVLAAQAAGFGAVKIRIDRADVAAGLAAVRAARTAAGDGIEIMVDLNQGWRMAGDISPALDVAAVRRLASELAELGVLWLEEPLPAGDLAGMRTLREQTGIRVAGGEMTRTPAELLDAVSAGALDVVQPDVVLAVGMLRARTVAEFAQLRHRWFTPHTWTNGLGLLANLHVAAGVGGGPYIEFPYDPPGWTERRRDFFLAQPVLIDSGGFLTVPGQPGLGVAIDESAVSRWALP